MASSPPAHRESSDNNHTYDLCFDIETRRQIYDNFSKIVTKRQKSYTETQNFLISRHEQRPQKHIWEKTIKLVLSMYSNKSYHK